MSTCPEQDLLSVYIDEELPKTYEAKLQEHLESCSKCKAHFEQLKALHSAFNQDRETISFSDEELDESFLRLKTKMNYKMVTKNNTSPFTNFSKWIMPVVAAAAVFVAVILPFRVSSKEPVQSFSPFLTGNNKVYSTGQVAPVNLIQETGVARDAALYNQVPVSTIGQGLSTTVIDIFTPDLKSENITININLSGFYNYNSQTPYENDILTTSSLVDVKQ